MKQAFGESRNERNSNCQEDLAQGLEKINHLLSDCTRNKESWVVVIVVWERRGPLHIRDHKVSSFRQICLIPDSSHLSFVNSIRNRNASRIPLITLSVAKTKTAYKADFLLIYPLSQNPGQSLGSSSTMNLNKAAFTSPGFSNCTQCPASTVTSVKLLQNSLIGSANRDVFVSHTVSHKAWMKSTGCFNLPPLGAFPLYSAFRL